MGIPPIPREYFGTDRTDEDLLTVLYLENRRLRALKSELSSNVYYSPPSPMEVTDDPKYSAVRDFLARRHQNDLTPRHLVIADDYPDYARKYGSGFIHRRVRAYQEAGLSVDVLRFSWRAQRRVYDYDNVRVLSGGINELNGLLTAQRYQSISAHFFNREMWSALYHHRRIRSTPFHVYVHGHEARHWLRRRHDIRSHGDLQVAMARSESLIDFWNEVVTSPLQPDKFVFVSRYWSRLMQEDMDLALSPKRIEIIHNFVDGELFEYRPKPPEQRFRILWTRSANASHYGADIAVEALRRMLESRHGSSIQATIVGDGRHFALFEDAFGSDPQVTIHRGYVDQQSVAELHRDHGLFLVPTRLDSQGVSRDEAMSSGLVPLTNSVAAVPEFADASCAILAPPNDATAMVEGALALMDSPERFLAMSEAASTRVRKQSGNSMTINREIALMTGALS